MCTYICVSMIMSLFKFCLYLLIYVRRLTQNTFAHRSALMDSQKTKATYMRLIASKTKTSCSNCVQQQNIMSSGDAIRQSTTHSILTIERRATQCSSVRFGGRFSRRPCDAHSRHQPKLGPSMCPSQAV